MTIVRRTITVLCQSVINSEFSKFSIAFVHCAKDNGHRWRSREGTHNPADRGSKLGLVEGVDAAPTPIEGAVETSER